MQTNGQDYGAQNQSQHIKLNGSHEMSLELNLKSVSDDTAIQDQMKEQ